MYKTHIQQWGLDKKNKEPEMRAIVRKHKQRADQGKDSTILVRGQIRTIREAFRYWERKGVSIEEIIARQTASPTPEAVMLSTPVPSPILTPQVLAIPERLFHLVQDYFKGSFESGTWFSEDPLHLCRSIKDENSANEYLIDLVDQCKLAYSLSSRNLSYEAEQTLRKAITTIKQILLAEHPATLSIMFGLVLSLRSIEQADMALFILRRFSVIGRALLGSEHPISRICEWFTKVSESNSADIAIRCVETVAGQLASLVGSFHSSTLNCRLSLIQIGTQGSEARHQKLKKLLGEYETLLRPEDPRVMEIRGAIANVCFSEGRYDDAMSLIQINIAYSQNASIMNVEWYDSSEDIYILAKCQHALGEVDLGITTLHQAIDVAISKWGTQCAQARWWLLLLEDWYSEQDLWDSAAMAGELRLITLGPMDVD